MQIAPGAAFPAVPPSSASAGISTDRVSAASTPVEKRGVIATKLAFGSLFVALVAGCRPQMELFAFLAVPIFWQRYIGQKRLCSRAGAGEAAAFILPVVVVAAGLMWYNAARFGSPLDFGAN